MATFQALDTFNTAVVSPIYYAMFTSLTIVASAIMFKVFVVIDVLQFCRVSYFFVKTLTTLCYSRIGLVRVLVALSLFSVDLLQCFRVHWFCTIQEIRRNS